MAFKSVEQINEERYHSTFRLVHDNESADVIFLYRSQSDELHADVHYIKSATYSGYVHCLGQGCPVCALKKSDGSQLIHVQEKLFIPVYNIAKGRIEFWDRNWKNTFLTQLDREIFSIYSNPSEYVFRITRHGEFNDKGTRYTFSALGRNMVMSYDQILAKFQTKMPDCYEGICRSYSVAELTEMLQARQTTFSNPQDMPAYVPVPRAGYQSSIPDTFVSAADVLGADEADIDNDPILSEFDDEDEDISGIEPEIAPATGEPTDDTPEGSGDDTELPNSPF